MPVPAFLIRWVGAKAAPFVLYGVLAALLLGGLGLFIWHERSIGAQGEVLKEQGRTIQVQEQAGKANENASTARVEGATRLEEQKGELNDAISNATSPADARHRRGCAILRQQGRSADAAAAGC